VILAFKYVYQYVADFLTIGSSFSGDFPNFGYAYVPTILISIGFFTSDVREAYYIVRSDDISDTFMNAEASRWVNIRSYDKFCLSRALSDTYQRTENYAMFVYSTLTDWKRLIFVTIPQLIICILILLSTVQDCDDKTALGAACTADCAAQRDRSCNIGIGQTIGPILSLIQAVIASFYLALSIFIYPCVRCWITADLGSTKLNLWDYTVFRIDMRLTALLLKDAASAADTDLKAVALNVKDAQCCF